MTGWTWKNDFSGATATFTCSVCGDECDEEAEVTPSLGTDKTEYTASVTFEGQTYTDKKVVYSDGIGARLAGHSISLNGDIGVNFYMELDPEIADSETAYMRFTIPNGNNTTVLDIPVSQASAKGSYYVFECNVAAKEMASKIKAQIINGNTYGTEYTYSVKEYADYLLENADENGNDLQKEYAKAAPLIKAMLNYGTAAQVFFDKNTDDPANADLSDDDKVIGNVSAEDINKPYDSLTETLPDGVTFEGATLSLKSETTLSLYFSSSEALTFSCEGKTVEQATKDGYQIARIIGINSKELQNDFIMTVTAGENSGTVTYSPMNYCYNVLNDDTQSDALQNVCKALYLYAAEADEYFD